MVNENVNNPASVWKLFKEIGIKKRNGKSSISSIKVGQQDIDDNLLIANEFNKNFVTVAANIKEPVEPSDFDKLKKYCNSRIPKNTEFTIPEISREKVDKYLKHIDLSKATGCDNIGPRLLKLAAPYVTDSITYICNESIKHSVFQTNGNRVR